MALDQFIPVTFLIIILILIIPRFLASNSKSKQLFKNLFIWSIIIAGVMIVSYSIFK